MGKLEIQLDWDSPNYFPLNGFHPLFDFLKNDTFEKHNIEFVNFSLRQKTFKYLDHDELYKSTLTEIREQNRNKKAFGDVWKFFDLDDRFLSEISCSNIQFEHTFPLSLGLSEFVFHIESVQSLFIPFIETKSIPWEDLEKHPDYVDFKNYIEDILISSNCKAIICNYGITEKNLLKLFPKLHPKKITTMNFLNMHLAHDPKPLHSGDISNKNRILFTHSFHMNVSSLKQRGLEEFLRLSKIIQKSDLLKHLKPTIIMPNDGPNTSSGEYRGIEVIRGYVPEKMYRNILNQSSYLFLPSPDIHSKAIIDCVKHNITPIVQRHLGYLELGLNEENAIFLSPEVTDPLTNYKETKKIGKINFDKLESAFSLRKNKLHRHFVTDKLSWRVQAGISDLNKLCIEFNKLGKPKHNPSPVPIMLGPAKEKFGSAPRFSLYCHFNNKYIFSNRKCFLFSGSAKTPSNFQDILNCQKDGYGFFVHQFDEFSKELHTSKNLKNHPVLKAWSFKDIVYHFLQDYKVLFLFCRFWYRLFKKLRKPVI